MVKIMIIRRRLKRTFQAHFAFCSSSSSSPSEKKKKKKTALRKGQRSISRGLLPLLPLSSTAATFSSSSSSSSSSAAHCTQKLRLLLLKMATHQYRSPSIIVRPTTSASPSASVRKQQQTLLEHHLHHPRSSPSSSTAKSSTAKSSSVPVHPGQKEQQKRSKMSGGGQKKKWGEDQMSDGDDHQLDGRMIKMTQNGPFLFVNSGGGGGDHRVRGRRETRRTEGGADGSNILGLFANNSKPTTFDDHPRTPTSSFVIPKTNRQSEPKRIPELQQLQCSFCALSADYHHHLHHHHNSSSSADDSLTSSSSSSNSITTTGTSEDFCSLNILSKAKHGYTLGAANAH
ncbi:hypothetical protein TYRP_020989, partial [Tyrophagus putrescentiae]